MKVKHSPFTKEFLRLAHKEYGILGLFWGSLILLTSCYVVSPEKYLFMKWGNSGSGKTISDKVALFFLEKENGNGIPVNDEIPYLIISSRLTPAGLAKLLKKESISAREFIKAKLILYEDLSKATTSYLQKTTIGFLASLTESRTIDDITSDGGGLRIKLSEKEKKCMLSGTPSQLDFLSSQDIFTEYIERRSLSVFVFLTEKEWEKRIKKAEKGEFKKSNEEIINSWKQIICEAFRKSGVQKVEIVPNKLIDYSSKSRKVVFRKLLKIKRFPENLMMMIDSLAKGHAMLNGRNCTIDEDYKIIDKLFSRFLYITSMKKKEFFLVEEVLRRGEGKGLKLKDLERTLRLKRKGEYLGTEKMVIKTIRNYAKISPYLEIKIKHKARKIFTNLVLKEAFLDISPLLRKLLDDWEKEIKELIK